MRTLDDHERRGPASTAMTPAFRWRQRAGLLICICVHAFTEPVRADEIDRYVAHEQDLYGVPAIVVGFYRDGELVDQRATGLVDIELGVPVDPRHAFEIGSISKQFTAWAIPMLREEGLLELDAPLGRYLPDLPAAWGAPTLHRRTQEGTTR